MSLKLRMAHGRRVALGHCCAGATAGGPCLLTATQSMELALSLSGWLLVGLKKVRLTQDGISTWPKVCSEGERAPGALLNRCAVA